MAVADNTKRLEEAKKQSKSSPSEAEATYRDLLLQGPGTSDASARDYENSLMGLGELYRDQKKPEDLAELVKTTRSELANLPKAKTAKIGIGDFTIYFPVCQDHRLTIILQSQSANS